MKVNNLPQKWDLYNFTGLPYFDDWPEGAEANARCARMSRKARITRKWTTPVYILALIAGIILLVKAFMWDFGVCCLLSMYEGQYEGHFLRDFIFGIILVIVAVVSDKVKHKADANEDWADSERQNALNKME